MSKDKLLAVFEIRRSIGDPITNDFILVDEIPETAQQNTAYTTGNGEYKYWDGVEWRVYNLKFSDQYIKMLSGQMGRINASIRLINNLIAQIDPNDYITSGNAGEQSVSFLSLSEILHYYQTLKEVLLEEQAAEAGFNSGRMFRTKKRFIGGVLESED